MSGFPAAAQIFIGDACSAGNRAVDVTVPSADSCVATKLSITGLGEVDGSVILKFDAASKTYSGTAYALDSTCKGTTSFPLSMEDGVCTEVDLSTATTLNVVLGGQSIKGQISSSANAANVNPEEPPPVVPAETVATETTTLTSTAVSTATTTITPEQPQENVETNVESVGDTTATLAPGETTSLTPADITETTTATTTNTDTAVVTDTATDTAVVVTDPAEGNVNNANPENVENVEDSGDNAANTLMFSTIAAFGMVLSYLL